MADIVLNHRAGGQKEFNENTKLVSETDFSSVKSKMCRWKYNEFHPSTFQEKDNNFFKDIRMYVMRLHGKKVQQVLI